MVIVASKSHANQETLDFLAKYPDAQKNARGSSLKFLVVASGMADLYPRLEPTMEWDTAAAHAIVLASGGKIVQYQDQSKSLE